MSLYSIILCGGIGARLWPVSTKFSPKQFHKIFNSQTLLENTINRLPFDSHKLFISNIDYKPTLDDVLNKEEIIYEPIGRNTAPAILMGCLYVLSQSNDDNTKIIVAPCDHVFDDDLFRECVEKGSKLIENDVIVTFGVKPTYPECGYGYIHKNDDNKILKFVEKPNYAKAEEYINDNYFLWNCGVFMFTIKTVIDEFKKHTPEIYNFCVKCYNESIFEEKNVILNDKYKNCNTDSFDYAIMEHTNIGYVLDFNGMWSDIGEWNKVYLMDKKDENNNISKGDVITYDTKNSYMRTDKGILTAIGLEDTIIVKYKDNVLVSDKSKCQHIKHVLDKLVDSNRSLRPWGFYECLDGGTGMGYQIKKISVYPNKRLSLQYHHKRSEHWTIVKGVARVEIGDQVNILEKDQSVHIKIGEKHRIQNIGTIILEFIEVQIGDYLEEDDIVRIEDDYGR